MDKDVNIVGEVSVTEDISPKCHTTPASNSNSSAALIRRASNVMMQPQKEDDGLVACVPIHAYSCMGGMDIELMRNTLEKMAREVSVMDDTVVACVCLGDRFVSLCDAEFKELNSEYLESYTETLGMSRARIVPERDLEFPMPNLSIGREVRYLKNRQHSDSMKTAYLDGGHGKERKESVGKSYK